MRGIIIEPLFEHGEVVYLKTDTDHSPRIVTMIAVHPGGLLMYLLACGDTESRHYECEISREPNLIIAGQ